MLIISVIITDKEIIQEVISADDIDQLFQFSSPFSASLSMITEVVAWGWTM